jgi:hypothetical protein
MEYLKKFATLEEYNAFVESGQMKRPNVSLVDDLLLTHYNAYIPNVYIQHIDGMLYTPAEWARKAFSNDVANGVALVTDKVRCIIAKTEVSESIAWSSSTNVKVQGITTTKDTTTALEDYDGRKNTQLMQETDTSGAGFLCANYIFPNGEKGYLPSAGEFYEICNNAAAINAVLAMIDATQLNVRSSNASQYWTSTQYDYMSAWCIRLGDRAWYGNGKSNLMRARAILEYNG